MDRERSFFRRRLRSVAVGILALYMLYAYAFGILIFAAPSAPVFAQTPAAFDADAFHSDQRGPDEAILLEDPQLSLVARIDLIRSAEKTLDLALHQVRNDQTSLLFYALLFEAADRGVKVRLLLDGYLGYFIGRQADLPAALIDHENIEFRRHEPLCLLRPWTGNNRLHSKMILADQSRLIIGGRNLSDRYFSIDDQAAYQVQDRDVLIFTEDGQHPASVMPQATAYFDLLWQHDAAREPKAPQRIAKLPTPNPARMRLQEVLAECEAHHPELFNARPQEMARKHETRKISLLHNPVARMQKEPQVLMQLGGLLAQAKHSVILQSPYVIPTEAVQRHLRLEELGASSVTILTNSMTISPNWFAQSAYKRYRQELASWGQLHEYEGSRPLHAKTFLIDDRLTVIGSFNLDPRSAFLSAEALVVIDSESLAQETRQSMQGLLEASHQVTPQEDAPLASLYLGKRLTIRLLGRILHAFEFML